MAEILPYIIVASMVLLLAVLFLGIFAFLKGGNFNKKYSNRLMRYRVMMQGAALLLFVIFMIFS